MPETQNQQVPVATIRPQQLPRCNGVARMSSCSTSHPATVRRTTPPAQCTAEAGATAASVATPLPQLQHHCLSCNTTAVRTDPTRTEPWTHPPTMPLSTSPSACCCPPPNPTPGPQGCVTLPTDLHCRRPNHICTSCFFAQCKSARLRCCTANGLV